MRLISAQVTGIGRLRNVRVNLDRKLIAIVGSNEAGKTTFLRALERITSGEPTAHHERSRRENIGDDDVVVSVKFHLDEEEIAKLREMRVAQMPRTYTVRRTASGTDLGVLFDTLPARDFSSLFKLNRRLEKKISSLQKKNLAYCLKYEIEEEARAELLQSTLNSVQSMDSMCSKLQEADSEQEDEIISLVNTWRNIDPQSPVIPILEEISEWLDEPLAMNRVLRYLANRRPAFLMFDAESRDIQSAYVLSDETISRPPTGLANIASLADLDIRGLWDAYNNGIQGDRSTILLQANKKLELEFAEVWKQSQLAIHLNMEGSVLFIEVKENNTTLTPFDQRSAGLRMFVALWSFLKSARVEVKPILLVDEAELHLHLDAQADLIDMFTKHEDVANVIYTTHSPGCLPPDLGTGVRVLSVSSENQNWSSMSNSFWSGSFGFSPLMMAMGAGATAFSTLRNAVLAEGAAEMLLLPTLIRCATGIENLEYQIAPGLAETPKRIYPELDLVAARVVYLVDDDAGGQALARKLLEAGIAKSRVISLGAVTLENLLDSGKYSSVCRDLILDCNPGRNIPDLPTLHGVVESWPATLEKWAVSNGLKMPSKIAVASRLVEKGQAIPSVTGKRTLKKLHRSMSEVFQLLTSG